MDDIEAAANINQTLIKNNKFVKFHNMVVGTNVINFTTHDNSKFIITVNECD